MKTNARSNIFGLHLGPILFAVAVISVSLPAAAQFIAVQPNQSKSNNSQRNHGNQQTQMTKDCQVKPHHPPGFKPCQRGSFCEGSNCPKAKRPIRTRP